MKKIIPYVGSKQKYARTILNAIPDDIKYDTIVEPFSGSYALSCEAIHTLKFKDKKFVYNDLSISNLAIFTSLTRGLFNDVLDEIEKTIITKEIFTNSKEYLKHFEETHTPQSVTSLSDGELIELAYHSLLLRNCSFNGLNKSMKPFKLDENKYFLSKLARKLRFWQYYFSLHEFSVSCIDASVLNEAWNDTSYLVFSDSPYMVDNEQYLSIDGILQTGRMDVDYYEGADMKNPEEHIRYANSFVNCKCHAIICGYENKYYDEILSRDKRFRKYILDSKAVKGGTTKRIKKKLSTGTEFLWTNFPLGLQEVPMNPKRKAVDVNGK